MPTLSQKSFSGGELSPSLHARVDINKYASGLATCKNFQIQRYGGASNRAGFEFVGETKDSTSESRLIPFIFSVDQTYILEFGNLYMRVIQNGAYVLEASKTITANTQANPAVITSASHGYANGDELYLSDIVGMTELNGRNVRVKNVTANTFQLEFLDAITVSSVGYTAYSSGGIARRVYKLVTSYVTADIPLIQYVQSADVITLVHQNYAPAKLTRLAHDSWQIQNYTFAPEISATTSFPGGFPTISSAGGAFLYRYKFTAVDKETSEESLPIEVSLGTITGITQAANGVVTVSGSVSIYNGDYVRLTNIGGMTQLEGKLVTITPTGASSFSIAINTTGYSPFTSGGTATKIAAGHYTNDLAGVSVAFGSFGSTVGTVNIYRDGNGNGIFGFQSAFKNDSGSTPTYRDSVTLSNFNDPPPEARNPFEGAGNYPACVAYIQQRLVFANTINYPAKAWTSRSGRFANFTTSTPSTDDQAITFTMVGKQVNKVRYLLDVGTFLVLTSDGEWAIEGTNGILTPTGVNPKQHSYNGSVEGLPPIVIGSTALYAQARGSIIRDLAFNYESDGYTGNDLSAYANHLFDDYTLSDWAYQQIPQSILWVVRSDGTLLGLTYVREQQVLAWHRHDTSGTFENVCVVPEGNEDVLYAIVKREVNGRSVRYVERLTTRQVTAANINEAIFMDSALSFDGRNTTTSHNMTLSGSGWTYTDTLTLTSSAAFFTSAMVDNSIFLESATGEVIRFKIYAYTSSTVVTGKPHKTVPANLQSTATATWSRAIKSVTGLWHLEGKKVSVCGDGHVVASPNNDAYTVVTVTAGKIELSEPYALIHVGLPYISDFESLDIDLPQGETMADKKRLVNKVAMHVEKTRGLFVGARPPTDDTADPLEGLYELKLRAEENYDEPVTLATDVVDIIIQSDWQSNGRVFVRQVDPLPASILSLMPSGLIPIRGGN
ncbi:MAG: hypothetical protein H0X02_04575 [Nitrosomonas sp.]|nr:hypothetical protein [Nitrosomonas sp.]